jgi:hypothetical protein
MIENKTFMKRSEGTQKYAIEYVMKILDISLKQIFEENRPQKSEKTEKHKQKRDCDRHQEKCWTCGCVAQEAQESA